MDASRRIEERIPLSPESGMIDALVVTVHTESAVETGREVADVVADARETGRQVVNLFVVECNLLVDECDGVVSGLLDALRLLVDSRQEQCQVVELLLDADALYGDIAAGVGGLLLIGDILAEMLEVEAGDAVLVGDSVVEVCGDTQCVELVLYGEHESVAVDFLYQVSNLVAGGEGRRELHDDALAPVRTQRVAGVASLGDGADLDFDFLAFVDGDVYLVDVRLRTVGDILCTPDELAADGVEDLRLHRTLRDDPVCKGAGMLGAVSRRIGERVELCGRIVFLDIAVGDVEADNLLSLRLCVVGIAELWDVEEASDMVFRVGDDGTVLTDDALKRRDERGVGRLEVVQVVDVRLYLLLQCIVLILLGDALCLRLLCGDGLLERGNLRLYALYLCSGVLDLCRVDGRIDLCVNLDDTEVGAGQRWRIWRMTEPGGNLTLAVLGNHHLSPVHDILCIVVGKRRLLETGSALEDELVAGELDGRRPCVAEQVVVLADALEVDDVILVSTEAHLDALVAERVLVEGEHRVLAG